MVLAEAAEKYPARPVRMIIPSGAGGITDILGRVIASKLGESLGQQVVVDNRPGASGVVGSNIVAKATPDGHTLLMVFPSHTVNQSLYPDMPYDTVKAFAPITLVSAVSPVLIVASRAAMAEGPPTVTMGVSPPKREVAARPPPVKRRSTSRPCLAKSPASLAIHPAACVPPIDA